MSTLRVSNIEAKADASSPSVDEKLKVTNSNGDVLVHIDGKTAGITTVGINTTDSSFTVDAAQNIEFIGIVTATKFSLSGGGEITGGDGNFTGIVTAASIDATSATFGGNVSIAGTLTYEDVTSIDSVGIITAQSDVIVGAGLSVVGISTLANTNINGQLAATNARITGVTTFGTSSTTINGAYEYPSIRPTLDLNFAATKTLDRRITFTRDSIGTYYGENGLVKYASNNVPRFDHDPDTGESLGLLIEESRTNLFPYGKTPGSNWSGAIANSTFTENTTEVTAPDGTNTATKWEFTSGDPYLYHRHTLLANTTYTMSMWVKAGTNMSGDWVQFRIGNAPYSIQTNSIIPTDGSWRRITYTKTIGGSNETNVNVGFEPQTSPSGNPASGDVIYIWGAQLEIGSFVTSFIPTSGSTVTRAKDTARITGTNFTDFYNQTEGTLVAHYYSTVDDNYIANIENVATPGDDRIGLVNYSVYQGYVETGNSSQASLDNGTPTVGDVNKVAFAFKTNDFAVSLNSATPTTDTSGTMPTVDRMMIGSRSGGAYDILKSTIRHLSYYPKRLPNAQLQGLTQQ